MYEKKMRMRRRRKEGRKEGEGRDQLPTTGGHCEREGVTRTASTATSTKSTTRIFPIPRDGKNRRTASAKKRRGKMNI